MLRALTPNRALIIAVAAPLAYWIAALFVPVALLREIFNSLAFGVALIITITWGPAAWRGVRENVATGEWQIILAIFVTWFVVFIQRCYAIVFNWYGRPVEWLDWPLTGFWPFSYTVAGLLLLAAPGVSASGFGGRAMWSIIVAVGIGSLVAGILIGVNLSSVL